MSLMLQLLLAALAVVSVLLYFTHRWAYQRGYDAGQLDAHLTQPRVDYFQRFTDRFAGMVAGFALGLKQGRSEKVQNDAEKWLFENLR